MNDSIHAGSSVSSTGSSIRRLYGGSEQGYVKASLLATKSHGYRGFARNSHRIFPLAAPSA